MDGRIVGRLFTGIQFFFFVVVWFFPFLSLVVCLFLQVFVFWLAFREHAFLYSPVALPLYRWAVRLLRAGLALSHRILHG